MDYQVKHCPERNCFEIYKEEYTGYLEYDITADLLIILHTIVPPLLQGEGMGSTLVKTAFDYASDHQLKVVPSCYFSQIWLKKHPSYMILIQ